MFMYTSETEQQTHETESVLQSWMRYVFCCGFVHEHVQNLKNEQQENALIKKYLDQKTQ